MANPSVVEIKIAVDTANANSGLAKLQADFASSSAAISKALGGVKGFDEIKKKTEETAKASDQLKTALAGQQQQLKQVQTSAASTGAALKTLAISQSNLSGKISDARKTLNFPEVALEVAKVKDAYATLASSGKLSTAELAQAQYAMGIRLEELRSKTDAWKESLTRAKEAMIQIAVVSAPTVLAINQAIKFESSMADVDKVISTTPERFAALRGEIVGLSRDIPMSVNELAQIAAAGGQLGTATNDIGAFVKVTAKMATAFDMTAREAGDSIGKIANVYRLGIAEIEGFGDTINQLGNNSASRERDIVDVMLRIGGTANQFGLAKEQAAALSAAMLSLGKTPEVASTSINALLNNMQTATMQTDKFKDALAKIGMSAEQMAAAVEANPQKALDDLLNTISKLSGQKRAEVLTGLFGREFQDDIGVLVGGLETYRDTLRQVADQSAYAGSMNKEFEARTKTTEKQLQLMKNAVVETAVNLGTAFLPAIKAVATPITDLIRLLADGAKAAPNFTAALVTIGTGAVVINQVAKVAAVTRLAIAGMGAEAAAATPAVISLTAASKALAGALVFFAAYKAGEWLTMRSAIKGTAEAQGELKRTTEKVNDALADISQSTGVTVTSMKQLDTAVKEGKLYYDELTGTWKAGAKDQQQATSQTAAVMKQATGDALKELQKKYREYASEVRRLQDEIASRERSLASELRSLARTGMSDVSAWVDQRKEAQEYEAAAKKAAEEAKAAFASGDTIAAGQKWKEALQFADDAKASYKDLNKEVKDGEQVVVTQQQALKTAMDGVKSSGELATSILKQQQEAATKAMNSLTEKSGFANLSNGMDEAERKWLDNWQNMRAKAESELAVVEERIQKIVDKDRTVYINVKTIEARSSGGMIGSAWGSVKQALAVGGGVRDIRTGGGLPGFGGGDTVPLWGEAGEYMINKWSTMKAGLPALRALNIGDLGQAVAELTKRMKGAIGYRLGGLVQSVSSGAQRLTAGGQVDPSGGVFGTVHLSFPSGTSVPVMTTKEQARALLREFDRMGWRASS